MKKVFVSSLVCWWGLKVIEIPDEPVSTSEACRDLPQVLAKPEDVKDDDSDVIMTEGSPIPAPPAENVEPADDLLRREDQRKVRHNQAKGRGRGRGRGRGKEEDKVETELPSEGEPPLDPATVGPAAEPAAPKAKPKRAARKRKDPATPEKSQTETGGSSDALPKAKAKATAKTAAKSKPKAKAKSEPARKNLGPLFEEAAGVGGEPKPAEEPSASAGKRRGKNGDVKGRSRNAKKVEVETVTEEKKLQLKPCLDLSPIIFMS